MTYFSLQAWHACYRGSEKDGSGTEYGLPTYVTNIAAPLLAGVGLGTRPLLPLHVTGFVTRPSVAWNE